MVRDNGISWHQGQEMTPKIVANKVAARRKDRGKKGRMHISSHKERHRMMRRENIEEEREEQLKSMWQTLITARISLLDNTHL